LSGAQLVGNTPPLTLTDSGRPSVDCRGGARRDRTTSTESIWMVGLQLVVGAGRVGPSVWSASCGGCVRAANQTSHAPTTRTDSLLLIRFVDVHCSPTSHAADSTISTTYHPTPSINFFLIKLTTHADAKKVNDKRKANATKILFLKKLRMIANL